MYLPNICNNTDNNCSDWILLSSNVLKSDVINSDELHLLTNMIDLYIRFCHILFLFTVHGVNPPVSVVRKFVHLLDIGDQDYAEEIGMMGMKTVRTTCKHSLVLYRSIDNDRKTRW